MLGPLFRRLEWAIGPSAAARTGMRGGGAATRTEFGSCRSENCKFGKVQIWEVAIWTKALRSNVTAWENAFRKEPNTSLEER